MPWKESTVMSERLEFVTLANKTGANRRELCKRYRVSSRTGYKWLKRFAAEGEAGLADRSRKPQQSPHRTRPEMEQLVVALRQQYRTWSGHKLRQRLLDQGLDGVPSASTITSILQRHNLLEPTEAEKHQPWLRFEHPEPNDLWQMDFKGEFGLLTGGKCFPLNVLDDHARFSLCLHACSSVRTDPTQAIMIEVFRRYGLPRCITCDNGPPWGIQNSRYTKFSVWLLRLGIWVSHSRPHHPQTQGKAERFHRTLKAEVLRYLEPKDLSFCQQAFSRWRYVYNHERPHEALGMKVPAQRYQPSPRPYPETLPPLEYGPDDLVQRVRGRGYIKYQGQELYLSEAFAGQDIALRFTNTDGVLDVYFAQHRITTFDLR